MTRELFPMAQRYKFESKSQLNNGIPPAGFGCFQWLKGTNLKANHNLGRDTELYAVAVSNGSKIQI